MPVSARPAARRRSPCMIGRPAAPARPSPSALLALRHVLARYVRTRCAHCGSTDKISSPPVRRHLLSSGPSAAECSPGLFEGVLCLEAARAPWRPAPLADDLAFAGARRSGRRREAFPAPPIPSSWGVMAGPDTETIDTNVQGLRVETHDHFAGRI